MMMMSMMMSMMMMTIMTMINDDHDHNHQDNDFYDDDDDNDPEMMIRALWVSWVNCGKVGGLYCSMVLQCYEDQAEYYLLDQKLSSSLSSPQKAHQV